jgi:hypothetical protein
MSGGIGVVQRSSIIIDKCHTSLNSIIAIALKGPFCWGLKTLGGTTGKITCRNFEMD